MGKDWESKWFIYWEIPKLNRFYWDFDGIYWNLLGHRQPQWRFLAEKLIELGFLVFFRGFHWTIGCTGIYWVVVLDCDKTHDFSILVQEPLWPCGNETWRSLALVEQ